jgi:hypothetical protein
LTPLLLCFLLDAYPDPTVYAAVEAQKQVETSRSLDLEFGLAVEDFVLRSGPSRPHFLLRGISHKRFPVREASTRVLERWGARALPVLAAAVHGRDPEAAHRADGVLRTLFACRACGGNGLCVRCTQRTDYHCVCDSYNRCPVCSGSGDLRYVVAGRRWEGGEWYDRWVPRNYFGTNRKDEGEDD